MTKAVDIALKIGAAAIAGLVLFLAYSYFVFPSFLDHGEPNNLLLSFKFLNGDSVYDDFNGVGRTTNLYGPFLYLFGAVPMALVGATIAVGKSPELLAALALFPVAYLTHRRYGLAAGLLSVLLTGLFICVHLPVTLWSRPDPWLALVVALAVWLWRRAEGQDISAWVGVMVLGVCGGVAVGLKIHGGFYLVPVAIVFAYRYGWGHVLTMGIVGVITTLAPFALPQMSLANYASWFGPMSGKPADVHGVWAMARYSLLYLVPAATYVWAARAADGDARRTALVYGGVFAFCILALFFPGSKIGSGRYHYFFPMVPIVVDMTVMAWQHVRSAAGRKVVAGVTGLLVLVSLVMSGPTVNRFFKRLDSPDAAAIRQEQADIMRDYPGKTIQMGVGYDIKTYYRTWQRPELVFAGNPYLIDIATMIETSFLGFPLSPESIDRVRQCETDIWLTQKGEEPFSLTGYYGNKVFSEAFRSAFFAHHTKVGTRAYFDLWACSPEER